MQHPDLSVFASQIFVAHLFDVSIKKVASQLTVPMSHTALALHTPESENISVPQFNTQLPFSR